jgi:exodeoxyribonuclease VII small subunit
MADQPDEARFEDQLAKLEDIVERLEDDAVGLEESLELFEQGMELVKACRARLEQVEQRVARLLDSEADDELTAPLDVETS